MLEEVNERFKDELSSVEHPFNWSCMKSFFSYVGMTINSYVIISFYLQINEHIFAFQIFFSSLFVQKDQYIVGLELQYIEKKYILSNNLCKILIL